MKKSLVLDFDGVICDSAGEMAVAAWRGGQAYWPDWNTPEPSPELIDHFRSLRPVVVTGYQAMALMRLLYCQCPQKLIISDFSRLEEELFASLGETRENLIRRFGTARDVWITCDPADWLAKNTFYPGIKEALLTAQEHGHLLFILSTKQSRFTIRLLNHAGIKIPETRIFGLESGRSKDDILHSLIKANEADMWFFIEDRPEALEKAAAKSELNTVRLLLADWGYNFPDEIAKLEQHSAIHVVALAQFIELCLT